jgi:hypothetical protein
MAQVASTGAKAWRTKRMGIRNTGIASGLKVANQNKIPKGDEISMSNFKIGADAEDFREEETNQPENNFTSLSSGTTLYVKVIDKNAKMSYYGYGMYKPQVYTFAAKNPSKKSKKGYPVEDLTPWDKAWKYHADKSEKFQDKHSTEAYKYMPKLRGSYGFYDLTSGEQIIIDFTKKQAKVIQDAIDKYEKRLDRMAFELSKEGSSTNTVVSMMPIAFPEEDLTEEQQKNFENAPKEFDFSLFEGVVYEMDDEEQVKKLHEVGFDVTKIGYDVPKADGDSEDSEGGEEAKPIENNGEPIDIEDSDLPF